MFGNLAYVSIMLLGVDTGWQPAPSGGTELLIQIDAKTFARLESGEVPYIESGIPPQLTNVRAVKVFVGSADLPREFPAQTANSEETSSSNEAQPATAPPDDPSVDPSRDALHGQPSPPSSAATEYPGTESAPPNEEHGRNGMIEGGGTAPTIDPANALTTSPNENEYSVYAPGVLHGGAAARLATVAASHQEPTHGSESPDNTADTRFAGVPNPNGARTDDGTGDSPSDPSLDAPDEQSSGSALVGFLFGLLLFASLGLNGFLGWIAFDSRRRYWSLLARTGGHHRNEGDLDGGEYPVEVRARDEEDDTPADPVAATLPDVDAYAVDDYDFDTDDDHDDEEGILPTEGKRKRRKTGKAVAERAGDTESVDWKFLDGSEPKQDPRAMRRRRSRKKRQRN